MRHSSYFHLKALLIISILIYGLQLNRPIKLISVKRSRNVGNTIIKGNRTIVRIDMSRSAELPTWKRSQSRSLSDYINYTSLQSFLWKPRKHKGFPNLRARFCDHKIRAVILVASAPGHFKQRLAIRKTWGSLNNLFKHGVRLAFVLGTTKSSMINDLIALEATKHDDIIQESFVDHFHNLTLKTIAMLKWINLTCTLSTNTSTSAFAGPAFIVKSDDDNFINVKNLVNVSYIVGSKSSMMGRLSPRFLEPHSLFTSKYYMPKYLYADTFYPFFLHGPCYMIRTRVVPVLLEKSLKTPLIYLEDVYVTGILGAHSFLIRENSRYFSYLKSNPKNYCDVQTKVNYHGIESQAMRDIWATRDNRSLSCVAKTKEQSSYRHVGIPDHNSERIRDGKVF